MEAGKEGQSSLPEGEEPMIRVEEGKGSLLVMKGNYQELQVQPKAQVQVVVIQPLPIPIQEMKLLEVL